MEYVVVDARGLPAGAGELAIIFHAESVPMPALIPTPILTPTPPPLWYVGSE